MGSIGFLKKLSVYWYSIRFYIQIFSSHPCLIAEMFLVVPMYLKSNISSNISSNSVVFCHWCAQRSYIQIIWRLFNFFQIYSKTLTGQENYKHVGLENDCKMDVLNCNIWSEGTRSSIAASTNRMCRAAWGKLERSEKVCVESCVIKWADFKWDKLWTFQILILVSDSSTGIDYSFAKGNTEHVVAFLQAFTAH